MSCIHGLRGWRHGFKVMVPVNSSLQEKKIANDVSANTLTALVFNCQFPTVQAHLQHYTEPTLESTPAASALSNTLLPLGPGTFTHNVAGVPVLVACTKADLIDEENDVIGAGTSGMGGMVKGKGGEWEERTDGIMQILRTICLKCTPLFTSLTLIVPT